MLQPPPTIRVLPPSVAERIAAGEVIERPSSVVKELVENSIDAGATEIAVILEDGGKQLIEIIDNGHGMTAGSLAICIERHATSKLSSLDDLDRITTLGFRGEALPSIGAVSEMSILSRTPDGETAYELRVGSGEKPVSVTFGHFLNSPHGTRIRAQGLFAQIPARLKFLKSQAAEVAHVREWLERLGVAHPQIGFRLVSDDRTVLTLRPQTQIERVQAILSDGDSYPVVTGNIVNQGIEVEIFWLQGLSVPQTRKLVQVVNGRSVRDRLLQQAILTSFRQALLPGQFPALALLVRMDPSQLDVNVHPTKTEIRFLDSRRVFHAISSLIEATIVKHGVTGYAAPQGGLHLLPPNGISAAWQLSAPRRFEGIPTQTPLWQARENAHQTGDSDMAPTHPLQGGVYLGTLFNTYLAYDLGEELALVDQHAAHERVRYEALKGRVLGPAAEKSSQALLIPEAVRIAQDQRACLESRISWMSALGFEVEIFGEETVLFRAIPAEWENDDLKTRLKNLVERVLGTEAPQTQDSQLLLDESLFESLASEACHSSVRAGDRLDPIHARELVESLFRCQHPWNCPHGRPTLVRVPRAKLEEWFQRRV